MTRPACTYSRLLFPVIASAGAVGLSIGLIIPLTSIVLEQRGISIIAIGLNATVYSLAVLLPSIAVAIRRLHDTSRSGWWLLIALVPFIGAIVLIIFYALDSTPGANRYGPNPKGEIKQPAPDEGS